MNPKWIKPSTHDFMREADTIEDFTLFDRIHGYIYAAFPYLYIGVGTGNHWIAKVGAPILRFIGRLFPRKKTTTTHSLTEMSGTIADTYHGKAVPLSTAKELVQIHEDVRIEDLEQVIPYVTARSLILNNPDHIAVLDCPCRSSQENPCLPLDVCLIIGEPFASFILDHHPLKSRQITAAEAVQILEEEDARGHVHHAFFKDAMLGRFYAICNCCACCCGAMRAQRNNVPMLASSGYLAAVEIAKCEGCGSCVSNCQFGALSLIEDHSMVDESKCMGCGVCVSKCEQNAISLRLAPEKGIPFEVEKLIDEAIAAVGAA
ncbi:MAG: 4Fe-4S binding protein [Anaerolineaceae bacterium]|nr:4Fe-4S binding protein [Anaerolineaceae bacterium]